MKTFQEIVKDFEETIDSDELLVGLVRRASVPKGFPYQVKLVQMTTDNLSDTKKMSIVVLEVTPEGEEVPAHLAVTSVVKKEGDNWNWYPQHDYEQYVATISKLTYTYSLPDVDDQIEEYSVKAIAAKTDVDSYEKLTKKLCQCPEHVDNLVGIAVEDIQGGSIEEVRLEDVQITSSPLGKSEAMTLPLSGEVVDKPKRGRGRPKKSQS
ncbi:MAG: hypothetical protein AAF378_10605 [Cyanobacteria bacterium P01_A01_bin.84]